MDEIQGRHDNAVFGLQQRGTKSIVNQEILAPSFSLISSFFVNLHS